MIDCLSHSELPERVKQRKREAQAGLEAARGKLLMSHPFFAHLALQLEIRAVFDHRLETAATDGAVIYFSAPFFEALSEQDRLFVLAHEVLHCVLGHHRRRASREAQLWNISADHEVNMALKRDGFNCPQGCVLFDEWPDASAEQIYDKLFRGTVAVAPEVCFISIFGLSNVQVPGNFIDPDYGTERRDLPPDVAAQMIRQAMGASNTVYGSLLGEMRQLVDKLPTTKPVSWQQVLRDFVSPTMLGDLAWHRPRRRLIGQGMYLPGRAKTGRHLLVAVDVSGSVFAWLPEFMAELSTILASGPGTATTVITFDVSIQQQFKFCSGEDLKVQCSKRFRGGGGTDFHPIFEFIEHDAQDFYDALVILTDGCGACPKEDVAHMPTLWALTKDGRKPCDWGFELSLTY